MGAFGLVLYFSLGGASLIFYVIRVKNNNEYLLSDSMGDMFLLMLGEINGKDSFNYLEWFFFVLFCIFIPIVMLNLLIAIIGDTFDRV